jgi:phytoene synthase
MPRRSRTAIETLFAIDAALGDVVLRSTDPALGRIKLAWWREQLEALGSAAPPAEPRLQAAAALLAHDISGRDLTELEAGWATLLDPQPDPVLVAGCGSTLFALAAKLIGVGDDKLEEAGALYSLAQASARRPELEQAARERLLRLRGHRFPRELRGLTMLASAALSRLEGRSHRSQALAMLIHRWTGRTG